MSHTLISSSSRVQALPTTGSAWPALAAISAPSATPCTTSFAPASTSLALGPFTALLVVLLFPAAVGETIGGGGGGGCTGNTTAATTGLATVTNTGDIAVEAEGVVVGSDETNELAPPPGKLPECGLLAVPPVFAFSLVISLFLVDSHANVDVTVVPEDIAAAGAKLEIFPFSSTARVSCWWVFCDAKNGHQTFKNECYANVTA